MIDRIEFQVSKTHEWVDKGKEQTKKALAFQSKARKV
jgi:hypothetical protein